ncbi:hypothetical protein MP638_002064 [Amoeboaphelidium occidentale]|nr:hypothetical protein MP638_002064 [Amoeboaphelidium occidentale]
MSVETDKLYIKGSTGKQTTSVNLLMFLLFLLCLASALVLSIALYVHLQPDEYGTIFVKVTQYNRLVSDGPHGLKESTTTEISSLENVEVKQQFGRCDSESEQIQLVFLLADGKSGSTIMAETLNQNDDIWYLFEPLHSARTQKESFELLKHGMINCDMTEAIARKVFWGYGATKNWWFRKTFSHPKKITFNSTELDLMNEQCRSKKIRVAKFIRLHDIGILSKLQNDATIINSEKCFKYKIISLSRDPKGIIASRIRKNWLKRTDEVSFRSYVRTLCNEIWTRQNSLNSISHNVVLDLRYEDFARTPETVSNAIYDFIGVKMPPYLNKRLRKLISKDQHRRIAAYTVGAALGSVWFYNMMEVKQLHDNKRAMSPISHKEFGDPSVLFGNAFNGYHPQREDSSENDNIMYKLLSYSGSKRTVCDIIVL